LTAYGVTLFVDHPVTGIGPGLFGQYYQRDARNGWSWRGTPLPKVGMPWVHSLPVEVLCELGVVGGLAFAAALVVAVRRAWRARIGSGLQGRVAVAVLAVLAAGFVAGLVDLTFIKDWVRCLFWLVLGLGLSCERWPGARTGQS
jgi:O-antigen ligase